MFDKAKQALQLFVLVLKTSKKLDIPAIQARYSFYNQRKVKITIHDAKRSFFLTLRKEGSLVPIRLIQGTPDNEIEVESIYTLKYIVNGLKPTINAKREMEFIPYSVMDAWTNGDITSDGRASTNMVFCVIDVVTECLKVMDADELDKILPDDADDYLREIQERVGQSKRTFNVKVKGGT